MTPEDIAAFRARARRGMSPAYIANEQKLVEQHAVVWRIEDDRARWGTTDPERENALAAAIGALHGYHFRDAELYFEERGIDPRAGRHP